ncbi:sensor histidine kinase [Micromonospora sp. CPCC 206061]|uniref:sensor histidine kinase n=1 Tax=Micromonospora sp. CPCC 206061 TaxID=3122410 RepID=UPI002FF354C8
MPVPTPRTAIEAVARRRFLASGWPWRSLVYLLTTPPLMLAAGPALALLALPWLVLLRRVTAWDDPSLAGLALLLVAGAVLLAALGPLVALPLGAVERWRLRLVDTRPVASAHRRPRHGAWLRTRYAEAATWRELGYAALLSTVIPLGYAVTLVLVVLVGACLASPFLVSKDGPIALGLGQVGTVGEAVPYALAGAALLPALPYLLALLAGAHAAVARALLSAGAGERLHAELVEVSRSRARLVDAFEAERRRIERDLHDGAQQRLVGLTLQLGLARLDLPPDSPAAQAVAGAHDQAKQLMAELRELIRGIHPQALTDSGLPAALRELADQSAIPVTVHTELSRRPPAPIETAAYFVAAEALANVSKHSGATSASVTATLDGHVLAVEIRDNGRGGADPGRGTGLTGLADRVSVVDGRMYLTSPAGGPTLIRVEIPCRQNSNRSG